ncbi:MAG: glycosyltransferase family 39 protein [Hyphomonadaceae bacterium]|nr:glycosyltransferase family 39 protein [Hyphomonadaceae bacterium]
MAAPTSPALFDQFARGWRAYALIALLALCAGLFGVGRVPVMDIDEGRFVQATRQMLDTGDFVRIKLQDADRSRKPAGIHWLQAASVTAMSPFLDRNNVVWPYRIPSVLGLVMAALATLWAGAALLGPRTGFVGAVLYATGILAGIEAMTAKTDSVLVGFTTLAIAALAQLRVGAARPRLTALVFWGALACGIMIKGPVTPMACGLTLLALGVWERRAAWMKPLAWWPGPLLAIAIALPWLIAIGVVTQGRFYTELWASELGPKLAGTDHAHQALPGYFLLLLPLLIFPATYALPAAARLAWSTLRAPRNDDEHSGLRFVLAWAVPTFLAFELMPSKLVHYTLPTYPAITLLCAAGLMAMPQKRWRTAHPVGTVLFAVFGALLVALMAFIASFVPGDFNADIRRAIGAGLIMATFLVGTIIALQIFRRPTARAGLLALCALIFSFGLRGHFLPEARSLFVSREAVEALTRAHMLPRPDQPFWVVGFTQPSFIFMTQTSVLLREPEAAAGEAHAGDLMMVEGRTYDETMQRLHDRGLALDEPDQPVRGIALGRGERTTLYYGRVVEADTASGGAAGDAPPRNP